MVNILCYGVVIVMLEQRNSSFDQKTKDGIAATLKDLREQAGLTQQQVADTVHLSFGTISHYELGITVPPSEIVYRLADLYGVSADYILNRCINKIDYTKVIDIHLTNSVTIGEAVEKMLKMNKKDRACLAHIITIMSDRNNT